MSGRSLRETTQSDVLGQYQPEGPISEKQETQRKRDKTVPSDFSTDDPVYVINHHKIGKMDSKRLPIYRVLHRTSQQRTSLSSYVIQHQHREQERCVHAGQLDLVRDTTQWTRVPRQIRH